MKALVYREFGGPEVLHFEDLPVPEPATGEVQVRVDGAGMNPVDWKIRQGLFPAAAPSSFPAVILREFSGTVTKLGPGVTAWKVGDRVYGITNTGAASEYTVASATAIGAKPSSLEPAEAGVVPLAAMTAYQALITHGHLAPDQRVLIHAAAGGVGTFAVQIAKWLGAYVIGTASSNHHALLKDLGADELIDYHKVRFEDVVRDVDLVLHSIGSEAMDGSLGTLRAGGRLVSILAPPDQEKALQLKVSTDHFMMQPNTRDLTEIGRMIDDGAVRVVIERLAPFDDAVDAMNELQQGHVLGKIGIWLTDAPNPRRSDAKVNRARVL